VRRAGHGGFSLVELVVVLAVIAVLAASVIPRYANTRRQAADSRVIALLGSMRSALMAYEAKYGSFEGLPCGNSDWYWNPLRDRLREFAELPDYQTLMSIATFVDGCRGYGSFAGRGYFVMMGPRGGTGQHSYAVTPDALWQCPPGWNPWACTVMR